MESKFLNTLQKLAKAGLILSKIIFWCCIVGTVGCLIGTVVLILSRDNVDSVELGNGLAGMIAGIPITAAEVPVSRKAISYFTHELAAGTPFTFDGAREMKKLGIVTLVYPLLGAILSSAGWFIIEMLFEVTEEFQWTDRLSIGLGIGFMILSVVLNYGAEILHNRSEEEKENA